MKEEKICSIVDYETYLAYNYNFCPMNINDEAVWFNVIHAEGRKTKQQVWYRKFIRKYCNKKLIPAKAMIEALVVAGCEKKIAEDIVNEHRWNDFRWHFRKIRKKRKLKIYYTGEVISLEEKRDL